MENNLENTQPEIKAKKFPKIIKLGVILLTIILAGLFVSRYVMRSKATVDIATVVFAPRTHFLTAGEQFSQIIRFNSGDKKISAIDLVINYNAEFVEYVPQTEAEMLNATIPPQYFTKRVLEKTETINGVNQVRIILVSAKPEADLLSDTVLSLNFKAKKASSTPQSIALNEPQSLIVGTTGTLENNNYQFDIDSSQAAATLNISEAKSCTTDIQCGTNADCTNSFCKCDAGFYNCDGNWDNGCEATEQCAVAGGVQLQLALKLQGINSTPATARKLKFKLTLYRGEKNQQQINDVELTASEANNGVYEGTVSFDKIVPADKFRLFIKGPKHVKKRFCHTTPTGGINYRCTGQEGFGLINGINKIDLTQVPLLTGDLPLPEQDGFLNSKDVVALRNCIKERSTTCINQSDLNYDGVTNGTDFTILLNSMAVKYDDEN